MVIEIKYDTWEEAEFLLNNVKGQAESELLEVKVNPSEKFKQRMLEDD